MCNNIDKNVSYWRIHMDISQLIAEKAQITKRLKKMNYGSLEIREGNNNKYIYVHFREDGILVSKYIGEFSNELYNLILENNHIAKELKKRLKEINKELKRQNYIESELDEIVELNLDFARRNLVDSIYKQAVLEGVATTYSDTEDILNGAIVRNMTADDIGKVVNLKHAWEFIMNKGVITYPSNYAILCQINSLVEEGFSYTAGRIRSIPVTIGGSSYIPPLPFEDQVKQDIDRFKENTDIVDRAIEALLYIMRKQIFLDGNKRTAVLFANHILIQNGKGLLVIPADKVDEYKKLLVHYYETDDMKEIKNFILKQCYMPLGTKNDDKI